MESRHGTSSPFHKRYPTSPPLPSFVSTHLEEDYDHPSFGLSMYDPTSPQRPVSFRFQTRTRRRSANKKCRKVYGIENRDVWCTQCKWKKACTRFGAAEKGDMTGLMYVTDYERLHLSV